MNTLLKYLVRNLGHLFLRNIFSNSYFSRKNYIPYGSKKAFIDLKTSYCVWGQRHQMTRVIFKNILFSRKMVFPFVSMESLIFGLFYWLLYYNFIQRFPFKGDCYSLKMPRPSNTLYNQFWGGLECRYAMSNC